MLVVVCSWWCVSVVVSGVGGASGDGSSGIDVSCGSVNSYGASGGVSAFSGDVSGGVSDVGGGVNDVGGSYI